jgi:hypothetical protein
MTSLVTESTKSAIDSGTLDTMSTSFGLVVVVLLIVVLLEQELMRAFSAGRISQGARRLGIASVPLLLIATAMFAARFAELVS